MPAILPLLIGAVILSDLMSAYVLFAEFARSRILWLLFISAAYCSTAMLTVPYILTFPGVFAASGFLGASGQTALHLWFVWHLGFPIFVLGAIFVGPLAVASPIGGLGWQLRHALRLGQRSTPAPRVPPQRRWPN